MSTTFNIVDPLPHMEKPMKIHVKENATPYAVYTPIPTPVHLREGLAEQLKNDVYNKILRKVPVGEANEWCARMVPCTKKDGSPRGVIDHQPLNDQCELDSNKKTSKNRSKQQKRPEIYFQTKYSL